MQGGLSRQWVSGHGNSSGGQETQGTRVGWLTVSECLQVLPGSPKPSHSLIISESPAPGVPKAQLSPINEGEVGKGRGCAVRPLTALVP